MEDNEKPALFNLLSDPIYPSWYRPSKYRSQQNMRVLQGRHPFGNELGPEDQTCGDCDHLYVRYCSQKYYKCAKNRVTQNVVTDCRKKWRSCALFEKKEISDE